MTKERRYFEAMKTASFSLFSVCSTVLGSHILLSDRLMALGTGLTPPDIELIDLGLSETALPDTLLATRAGRRGLLHDLGGQLPLQRGTRNHNREISTRETLRLRQETPRSARPLWRLFSPAPQAIRHKNQT